ncbi:hypothetical protein [uncultured Stenotrophomonas sp.]|uniref:hypothetical protein n=1 Tax=uncultured Stenotrophomonas sp. TaxID=165438 RepID=UPI0028EE5379|nr:hypothetical protein [uncultured Stenotrophomonas sp.]
MSILATAGVVDQATLLHLAKMVEYVPTDDDRRRRDVRLAIRAKAYLAAIR